MLESELITVLIMLQLELANFIGRPYFVKVEPMSSHVVWRRRRRLSVCPSVTFCIVAKRYIIAKNCLKEQIELPPRLLHGTNSEPHSSPNVEIPV